MTTGCRSMPTHTSASPSPDRSLAPGALLAKPSVLAGKHYTWINPVTKKLEEKKSRGM
jgi:hypothetical protein